jgi:hypothetical protein
MQQIARSGGAGLAALPLMRNEPREARRSSRVVAERLVLSSTIRTKMGFAYHLNELKRSGSVVFQPVNRIFWNEGALIFV